MKGTGTNPGIIMGSGVTKRRGKFPVD